MSAGGRRAEVDAGFPILLYHSIADSPPAGQRDRFTVPPAIFDEHLAAIAASGRAAMTISEVARALTGDAPFPERAVAVTFDDGFDDTLPAVEALSARGISSTVYVTTGAIDTARGISLPALRALAGAGAEVGAHTVTHPHLDEIRAADCMREIRDSRHDLEQRLESEVASFAYPHGSHHRRVRAAVIDAGFSSAAAVKNALSHAHDDPFAIARWTVTRETTLDELEALLDGRGAPLAWIGERYATKAFRRVRRLKHRLQVLASPRRPRQQW